MNPPNDKVTADAREMAGHVYQLVWHGNPQGSRDRIAAVLAPVLARAEAAERERDQLRAEIVRLEKNLYTGDDDEKQALRAALADTMAKLGERDGELAVAKQEVERLTKKQPINTHVRLFDLVRFMRTELARANLITEEEYAWLCFESPMARGEGSPSPRRLEDYDDLRAQLAAAREDKERMADLLAASLRYIPAGAFYGDFATMTKEEGSLALQVGFAIATARGTNHDAARREGGAK